MNRAPTWPWPETLEEQRLCDAGLPWRQLELFGRPA